MRRKGKVSAAETGAVTYMRTNAGITRGKRTHFFSSSLNTTVLPGRQLIKISGSKRFFFCFVFVFVCYALDKEGYF